MSKVANNADLSSQLETFTRNYQNYRVIVGENTLTYKTVNFDFSIRSAENLIKSLNLNLLSVYTSPLLKLSKEFKVIGG